jgi:O-antigen/teichoic acid export membrane protein
LVLISFISIKFIVLNLLAKISPENLESIQQIDIIFSILCYGLFFYSGWIVFENIFIMANKPKLQSYFIIFANILNILLTIIFINLFGILGAAYATSFTFVMLTIILNLYARKIQYNK